jgi:hypothetical protein
MTKRKVDFNEAIQKVRADMATKKTSTTRKGGKTRTKPTAGKTAKTFKVPRTEGQLADAILVRMKTSPHYWENLQTAVQNRQKNWAVTSRVAQVRPRTNAPEPRERITSDGGMSGGRATTNTHATH